VIVTFYSYKGGVGRSMALANVAAWFRLQGLQVVMIDWDLEAPGLESFFATTSAERDLLRAKFGLVDLLSMYKDLFPSLPKPVLSSGNSGAGSDSLSRFVEILDEMLPLIAHALIPIRIESAATSTGKLSLLSAGCRNESRFSGYAQTVQQFDWEEFYARYQGEAYIEWMRGQLLKPNIADVVLIDSRTGVAEMSGVCTRQLADVVVMLCAPNDQNLEGTAAMAKSFTRPDVLAARRGRPIELLPIPARVDVSEGRLVDIFEEQFRDRLGPFIPELLRGLPVPKNPLLTFGNTPMPSDWRLANRLALKPFSRRTRPSLLTWWPLQARTAPSSGNAAKRCKRRLDFRPFWLRAWTRPTPTLRLAYARVWTRLGLWPSTRLRNPKPPSKRLAQPDGAQRPTAQ